MKSPAGFLLLASMAYTSSAAPAEAVPVASRDVQAAQVDYGSGQGSGNIFSNIFDTGACLISGFLGGGCRRPGSSSTSTTTSNDNSNSNSNSNSNNNSEKKNSNYDFNYSTNKDGTLKIKITPGAQGKSPCNYDSIDGKGRELKKIIDEVAERCLN